MLKGGRSFDFRENVVSLGVKTTQKSLRQVVGAWHGTGKKFLAGELRLKRNEGFKWVFKNFEVYVKLNDLLAGKILNGNQAHIYIKEHIGSLEGLKNMKKFVFFYPCVLCLAFGNSQEALIFEKFLQKTIEQGVRVSATEVTPRNKKVPVSGNLGAVFDIMEIGGKSELWAEFQMTLIDDDTSYSEKILFDKSQSNLKKSVNECKNMYKDQIDSVNFRILESFLVDVSRSEYIGRVKKIDSVKKISKIGMSIEYDRKTNSRLRNKFLHVNQTVLEKDTNWLMRKLIEMSDFDDVGSMLCTLYLQKLQISMETCQLALGHKDVNVRRSFDSTVNGIERVSLGKSASRVSASKSPMRRGQRIDSPSKRPPGKKSFFREACDCIIY